MNAKSVSVAVTTAGMVTFLNLYTPQAILPALAAAFGINAAQTGLAVTASLFAVAIIAPFAGAISDMVGRKRLIVGAALAVVAPTLLVATAPSFPMLVFWRFLQGLLLPFIFTVTVAYIGDECHGSTGIRAAGFYASGSIAGGFVGRLIAGLAAEFGGWRVGFAAVAAVTALGAAVIMITLPHEAKFRPLRGGVQVLVRGWREHLGNPLLWGTCAVGAGMLFSIVATFTYINLRLAEAPFGLSPGALGAVFAVYLVGVVTTPLATRLAVRIGRAPTARLATVLALAGELVTLTPSLPGVISGLTMACAGLFVAQALALGFIGIAVPRARSSAVGLYVAVYYIGGALGGILPAPLWRMAGWPGCVALVCTTIAGMGVAAHTTFGARRHAYEQKRPIS